MAAYRLIRLVTKVEALCRDVALCRDGGEAEARGADRVLPAGTEVFITDTHLGTSPVPHFLGRILSHASIPDAMTWASRLPGEAGGYMELQPAIYYSTPDDDLFGDAEVLGVDPETWEVISRRPLARLRRTEAEAKALRQDTSYADVMTGLRRRRAESLS